MNAGPSGPFVGSGGPTRGQVDPKPKWARGASATDEPGQRHGSGAVTKQGVRQITP